MFQVAIKNAETKVKITATTIKVLDVGVSFMKKVIAKEAATINGMSSTKVTVPNHQS